MTNAAVLVRCSDLLPSIADVRRPSSPRLLLALHRSLLRARVCVGNLSVRLEVYDDCRDVVYDLLLCVPSLRRLVDERLDGLLRRVLARNDVNGLLAADERPARSDSSPASASKSCC
jgi:hypothetical protein